MHEPWCCATRGDEADRSRTPSLPQDHVDIGCFWPEKRHQTRLHDDPRGSAPLWGRDGLRRDHPHLHRPVANRPLHPGQRRALGPAPCAVAVPTLSHLPPRARATRRLARSTRTSTALRNLASTTSCTRASSRGMLTRPDRMASRALMTTTSLARSRRAGLATTRISKRARALRQSTRSPSPSRRASPSTTASHGTPRPPRSTLTTSWAATARPTTARASTTGTA